MKRFQAHSRIVTLALISGFFLTPTAIPELIPTAEASLTKDKRKIRKLRKQSKNLRLTILSLQAQLTASTRPVPEPGPFVEMVKVGNVGNATDAGNTADPNDFGAVNYEFSIGKYEVNLTQYIRFLNAVAASDPYGLYNPSMGTNPNSAGIERSGSDGSYTYSVIGSGDRPAAYLSWFDAARFCNWLHNGGPTGAQDASTTERGAYTLDGATSGGLDITRNPGANYWIPSADEWYKTAYHQPSGQGGDGDDYWRYPTASNTIPGNAIGPLPLANHANHQDTDRNFSVTQSGNYDPNQNYLTDGGSYEGSATFYETFDQGGNVWEWTEAVSMNTYRVLRGGSFFDTEKQLRSSTQERINPDFESSNTGFRVAGP